MFKSFISLMLCGVLSGCALTTEQVNFNYHPDDQNITKVNSHTAFVLDPASDTRGVPPNLIVHKTNENQQEAEGGYVTQKPVSQYIDLALNDSLTKAGYHLAQGQAPLHLSARILNISYDYAAGFWGPSKIYCSLQVDFSLNNSATGVQLWDDTFVGKGSVDGNDSDPIPNAFNSAINNLASQLVSSKSFQYKLKG